MSRRTDPPYGETIVRVEPIDLPSVAHSLEQSLTEVITYVEHQHLLVDSLSVVFDHQANMYQAIMLCHQGPIPPKTVQHPRG